MIMKGVTGTRGWWDYWGDWDGWASALLELGGCGGEAGFSGVAEGSLRIDIKDPRGHENGEDGRWAMGRRR
jgi:hypothetical protein